MNRMDKLQRRQLLFIGVLGGLIYFGLHYLSTPRYFGSLWSPIFVVWLLSLLTLGALLFATPRTGSTPMRKPGPEPDRQTVAKKLDEIEAEMKRIGLWQSDPLPSEKYEFKAAFGADAMSIDQWLQFVFIPRVREIIATDQPFPPSSSVAPKVLREFDASPYDITELHMRLYEFDRLFD
jgi:uncharacterized protein YqcC (DUF446 family)